MAREAVHEFVEHLSGYEKMMDEGTMRKAVGLLSSAPRVFVYGAGRAGWVGRAFAQRLMLLGLNSYFVGETITPAFGPGDVLVAVSASGKTATTLTLAQKARDLNGKVMVVTATEQSPISVLADHVVFVPGRTKGMEYRSLLPLSTLFLNTAQVIFDAMVVELMRVLKVSEKDTLKRHATLE